MSKDKRPLCGWEAEGLMDPSVQGVSWGGVVGEIILSL